MTWGIIALTEKAVIGKQSNVYKCKKVDQKIDTELNVAVT